MLGWSLAFRALAKMDCLMEHLQAVATWVFKSYQVELASWEDSYAYPSYWLCVVHLSRSLTFRNVWCLPTCQWISEDLPTRIAAPNPLSIFTTPTPGHRNSIRRVLATKLAGNAWWSTITGQSAKPAATWGKAPSIPADKCLGMLTLMTTFSTKRWMPTNAHIQGAALRPGEFCCNSCLLCHELKSAVPAWEVATDKCR